ncbi:BatD family protein [Marinicella litoralis]|uniref:Oxygen tolerance protein BatD n=1 Tax=Marinicella litoralis TaxID=644220 RepID=A0A4R6XUG1_9GAMM|nr:BatD family protein [Marinicella litoralis]TDR23632.1 oxygen tolerance protein BatD [Marinicella litoralis]
MLNSLRKPCIAILLMVIGMSVAHAELKATVDRQLVLFGESLTLTITSDQNTNSQPDFTLLDAVFHVGQTGKSSSTQIINGSVSTQTTWQVLLVPKSLGSHLIPPLEIDGERTNTIKIEVKKPDPNAQAKGDIFIEIEADKTSAYVQEEILLTVRLLYAISLKTGSLSEPSADGVIVQQINKGANYTTQRNNKTYQVLERKYAIFVENSGTITLNPLVFDGEVTDNSRQSFGLFQRGRPVRQVSEMLELEIKQIPQEFVAKPWIPAKQVALQQSWSQDKPYQVGEPITRTINLTVTGLSETQLPDLLIDDIKGAKIYQDKTDTLTRTDGQQLIASKVIKYAVIPTEQGSLEIPEFTLEWFDTNSQTAKTARIPATTLPIEAADASTTQAPKAINFNPIDIPDTQAIPAINHINSNADQSLWKILTLTFAFLWLLTSVFFWSKLRHKPQQTIEAKKPTNTLSIKHLNQASAADIQAQLIAWWNQQYQQKTTNLGQIRQQLADGDMKQAITDLQKQLYAGSNQVTKIDWVQLIKKNQFKPAQQPIGVATGLPELYG